jgi:hypothetical protein
VPTARRVALQDVSRPTFTGEIDEAVAFCGVSAEYAVTAGRGGGVRAAAAAAGVAVADGGGGRGVRCGVGGLEVLDEPGGVLFRLLDLVARLDGQPARVELPAARETVQRP